MRDLVPPLKDHENKSFLLKLKELVAELNV